MAKTANEILSSSTLEKLENSNASVTVVIEKESFEKGIEHAYQKNKTKINVPGFRKGKVPRQLIEKQFGKEMFYDDAIDFLFPDVFQKAVKDHDLKVVARPELEDVDVDADGRAVLKIKLVLRPDAKVSKYTGFTYKKADSAATPEEITAEVDKARDKNARIQNITDRPVVMGDKVTIDYKGSVDGEYFEGGTAEGHELEIGSHTFIDNFEEQLIGAKIGDDIVVSVKFPEGYRAEHLAGKDAKFECTVHAISCKELPEADDEFAQDVSEFETLVDYRDDIAKKITERKEQEAAHKKEDEIMRQFMDELVCEIPEVMFENQLDNLVRDAKRRIQQQGMQFEMYLQYLGQTEEGFREALRPRANDDVKLRLALECVAEELKQEITEEEFNAELERIAAAYGMEVEKLSVAIGEDEKESMKEDMLISKAVKYIVDNSVEE